MRRFLAGATLLAGAATFAHAGGGVLLIPNSSTDSIWAFSPVDGALINNNLIPDAGVLGTPTTAIDSGRGSIFVSDQITDGVFEFGYDGSYLGQFAGAAQGLDNVRGITLHDNRLYVANQGNAGGLGGTIQRFDLDGSNQSTWSSGNTGSPWWIHFRANDVLVSDSDDDNVESLDANGAFLGTWVDGDGLTSIDFPRQIHELPNGNILVGGFSPPSGIYEYDSNGNQLATYATAFGMRGVWALENGQYLFTSGTLVGSVDPATGVVTEIFNQAGNSFQHIGFSALPEPTSLVLLALGGTALLRRR